MDPPGQSCVFGSGVEHHALRQKHPVEREAIFAGVREDVYMNPAIFRERLTGAERNRALREATLRDEEARRRRAERDFWDRPTLGEWCGER
jgi:hypothetical protein